jgi:NitT/TauT family transport system substrate-binding protein
MSCLKRLLAAVSFVAAGTVNATAAEKITFMMSWKAQAEQGGFYNALVKGYYSACGVDITIRQGGPGIDPAQLLAGGAIDFSLAPFIDTVLLLNQAGFPARAVMGTFQRSAQILMTHSGNGINMLEEMRGKPIMIAAISRKTFWPFFRDKYGWSDAQIRAYTGQLATFFADKNSVQQAFITNEPFLVRRQTGDTPKTFLLADYGYLTYGSIVTTSQTLIDKNPKVVECVVQSSVRGWNDYLVDPKSAFEIIQREEPQNTNDLMTYAYQTIKDARLVQTNETEEAGIGTMNDERWKAHYEMLVDKDLIKPMDYKSAINRNFLPKKAPKLGR